MHLTSLSVFLSQQTEGTLGLKKNKGLDQLPNILPPAIHPEFFTELALVPSSPNVLYTIKNWLIYKSIDGGENWIFSGTGTESVEYVTGTKTYFISDIIIHPTGTQTLYAGTIVGGATGAYFNRRMAEPHGAILPEMQ
jgi:hypothetical protein